MLYFVSLYYKNAYSTGANRRFDALGKELLIRIGSQFRVIVCEGQQPGWAPDTNCLFVSAFKNPWQRIRSSRELGRLLGQLAAGHVVSDFMPIPFAALKKHQHFQLIHDLRNFTEFKRGGLSLLSAAFQKRQLSRSRKIITVSAFSKNEIVKRCNISPQKIIVSYNGIGEDFLLGGRKVQKEIDVLYIATFEPRKNHLGLLRGMSLSPTGLKVRFVGRDLGTRAEVKDLAKRLQAERGFSFEFIESMEDAEIVDSYRRAKLFAFPSMLEGFGMPLIEALASNCRVVCSDIPVFRELCQDRAGYFDPSDPDSIWQAMSHALRDEHETKTATYARRFLWGTIARDLIRDLNLPSETTTDRAVPCRAEHP